jgi:Zn-finger nucleic acid-binding protein
MAKKYCPICQIHIAEKKYELHLKWHKKNTKGKTFIVNEHGIVDSVQTHNLSRLNSNPFISTDRPKENHYVVCPECNILLKASKLEFHLEQAHSESEPHVGTPNNSELPQDRKKSQFKQFLKGQQPWAIFCPVCDVKLKSQDRLAKHLAKVHSDQMPEQKGTVPVKPACQQKCKR